MQYFSKSFTVQHIVNSVELPADIQVYSNNKMVAKVRMVMSKAMVDGKEKGGAMITTNWKQVVKANDMRIGDIYIFCFGVSEDGLKLIVGHP